VFQGLELGRASVIWLSGWGQVVSKERLDKVRRSPPRCELTPRTIPTGKRIPKANICVKMCTHNIVSCSIISRFSPFFSIFPCQTYDRIL
jgi:hypothetical protein